MIDVASLVLQKLQSPQPTKEVIEMKPMCGVELEALNKTFQDIKSDKPTSLNDDTTKEGEAEIKGILVHFFKRG